jgi:hypothetical protein
MIEVKQITPQTIEHFDPEGDSLGFLNQIESADLCSQIAEHFVGQANVSSGYYLMFNDKKINIKSNGDYDDYPYGFYDQLIHITTRKIKGRRGTKVDWI